MAQFLSTQREAVASAKVTLGPEVFGLVSANAIKKVPAPTPTRKDLAVIEGSVTYGHGKPAAVRPVQPPSAAGRRFPSPVGKKFLQTVLACTHRTRCSALLGLSAPAADGSSIEQQDAPSLFGTR